MGSAGDDVLVKSASLGLRLVGQNHALGAGKGLDEFDALGRTQNESGGGKDAGMQAGARDDGGLGRAVGHGPPGARVDDVTVAAALHGEVADVVPGRSHAAV